MELVNKMTVKGYFGRLPIIDFKIELFHVKTSFKIDVTFQTPTPILGETWRIMLAPLWLPYTAQRRPVPPSLKIRQAAYAGVHTVAARTTGPSVVAASFSEGRRPTNLRRWPDEDSGDE